jgi:tetratricopeptide (TPR) repeat protein
VKPGKPVPARAPANSAGTKASRPPALLGDLISCVVLAALVTAAFLPVLNNGFINYDDELYVTTNPHVRQGLSWNGAAWAFQSLEAHNWHPLTWLSHMLDSQLSGARASGHHLTSLVLHVTNTLLLFGVLRLMTGALAASFLAAALFGLHPLHVESVAWVAERKDVLSAFFFFLTLWAYGCYANGRRGPAAGPSRLARHWRAFYALALVFFALGLMSKPMVVTLPFVLLLVDYWPLQRLVPGPGRTAVFRRLLLEKAPFLVLSAAACAVALLAQARGGAVIEIARLPFGARVENALVSCGRYLEKTIWPADLAIFYPHPGHWGMMAVLGSAVALLVLTGLAVAQRETRPWITVGWFWFFGMLVPVLGLVQVGRQAMADRYTYLPLVGLFIVVAWGAVEFAKRLPYGAIAMGVASAALLMSCTVASHHQTQFWKDSETVFQRAIAVTSNNYVAHNNLGIAFLRGNRLEEAEYHFRAAARIKADDPEAHTNLGNVLCREGKVAGGMDEFRLAIQLKPDSVEPRHNLGIALCRQGKLDEGIAELEQVTQLRPNSAEGRLHLAMGLALKGRREQAIEQLNKALQLRPNYPEAEQYLQKLKASTPVPNP